MKIKDKDFNKDVFPEIIKKLGEKDTYYTKTTNALNRVRVRGSRVDVMTKKSNPNYEEIPHKFFVKTWDLLCQHGTITQNELSKKHYVKRSAFMFIAFDLLDFVEYDRSINAIRLKSND